MPFCYHFSPGKWKKRLLEGILPGKRSWYEWDFDYQQIAGSGLCSPAVSVLMVPRGGSNRPSWPSATI